MSDDYDTSHLSENELAEIREMCAKACDLLGHVDPARRYRANTRGETTTSVAVAMMYTEMKRRGAPSELDKNAALKARIQAAKDKSRTVPEMADAGI